MVFILLVVFLLLTLLFAWLYRKYDDTSFIWEILFGIASVVALIILVCLLYDVNTEYSIDDKITMYQEENAEIEKQIGELVQNYMDYEQSTFDKTKSNVDENAMTLISMFPELKSDNLVAHQIDIYTQNKQKVISLKEQKVNISKERWLLYFGR